MATIQQLLEALNTKGGPVSTADLATELKASKEGTLKQLKREKEKGNIDGNSEEGWLITDNGRKALETGVHPSMIDEGVTPRQRFESIGQRIGIKEDRIILATDIVWSGDHTDIKWVWEALGQADIADDLRSVWVNAWRAKLHKAIPPELEPELTGVAKTAAREGETGVTLAKVPARDYIIIDDEPVRVGPNLGDYSLQDAKDILSIRALRSRFASAGQGGSPPAVTEKVSEILTALEPYINKSSDTDTLKEILADKLALQRQEILSHIPQPSQTGQPKSFIEQVTDFAAALGRLKDAGPVLRSILGVPESSSNPGMPVQVTGPAGQPVVMDLGQVIDWRRFQNEEKRADERHQTLMGLAQTVRENIPDGITALKEAAAAAKQSPGATTPTEQIYQCGNCKTQFKIPAKEFERVACPTCKVEYTREQVMSV